MKIGTWTSGGRPHWTVTQGTRNVIVWASWLRKGIFVVDVGPSRVFTRLTYVRTLDEALCLAASRVMLRGGGL